MRIEYVYMAVAAVMWGAYPLVARSSGISGAAGALVLTLAGLVPITLTTLWEGTALRFGLAPLTKLIVAGMMMGIGLIAFTSVASSRQIDASISIPIIDTAMLLVTVVGAVIFFAEPMTIKKVLGITLLLAGIVLLRPAA